MLRNPLERKARKRYLQLSMTKTLTIENHKIDFRLIEDIDYWCWQGYLTINGAEVEIEIDSGFYSGVLNWENVEKFIGYIIINEVIKKHSKIGTKELTIIGRDFFQNTPSIKDWKMNFKNSIYFLGANENNFTYGFLYDFIVIRDGGIDGDPYGLYMVRMENEKMLNAERHQL